MRNIQTIDDILDQPKIAWMLRKAKPQIDTEDDTGKDFEIANSLFFTGKLPARMGREVWDICKEAQKIDGITSHNRDYMHINWDNGAETAEEFRSYVIICYLRKWDFYAKVIVNPGKIEKIYI